MSTKIQAIVVAGEPFSITTMRIINTMEIPNRILIIRKVTLLNVSRIAPPTIICVREAIKNKLISKPIISARESHNLLEVKIIHLFFSKTVYIHFILITIISTL